MNINVMWIIRVDNQDKDAKTLHSEDMKAKVNALIDKKTDEKMQAIEERLMALKQRNQFALL